MEVANLAKHYPMRRGLLLARTVGNVRAVDGVSFQIFRGETLALVGESGCGKSTTARLVLRLIEPTAGSVRFEDADITTLRGDAMRRLRRRMQIVFQDPFASLNPRMTVAEILEEPLIVHGIGDRPARRARVEELLQTRGSWTPYLRTELSRTSSPAGSGSGSALPAPWRSSPRWWYATSRSARWTFRSRRRW